jgi:hypothetical protein
LVLVCGGVQAKKVKDIAPRRIIFVVVVAVVGRRDFHVAQRPLMTQQPQQPCFDSAEPLRRELFGAKANPFLRICRARRGRS